MKVSQIDRGGELESNTATGLVVKYWHFIKKKITKKLASLKFDFYPNADLSFPRALSHQNKNNYNRLRRTFSERYPGSMPSRDTLYFIAFPPNSFLRK